MNEILKQTHVLSEAEGLTNLPQTPYAKGGDIFMEGKQDMPPQNSQPTNPEHSEKAPQASKLGVEKPVSAERQNIARRLWDKFDEGRVLSVDERRTREEIIKKGLPPVAGGTTGIPPGGGEPPPPPPVASETPPEESNNHADGEGNQEAGSKLESSDYDTTRVTNPVLRRIGDRIDMRLKRGLMDYREVERAIQEMEAIAPSWEAGDPDGAWGRNLYDKLYDEVVRQRQLAGEVNWEKVKEDLRIATKDGNLGEIERIVRGHYDFNERINVNDLVEVSLSNDAIEGNTYGYALEYVLESIINVADLTPLGTIPNPTFQQSENISRLIKGTLIRDQDINKDFYIYLKDLQEKRGLSHELYKSMSTRGAYEKYVGEHLKNDGFRYLENQIVGVSETQGLWEKVMARKKGKKEQILSQAEFDKVHEEVRGLFKKNANLDADGTSQKLKKRLTVDTGEVDEFGDPKPFEIERSLREWEIDRAAVVGRSVAHVSGRAITYGMIGDLPTIDDELFESMNAEYPARIQGSMKVSAQRFIARGSNASNEYIKTWVKNKIQIAKENGWVFGEGEKSLYGQKLDSAVYLDTGVPDLKSHGWRNRRTQLKNSKFAKVAEHDPNDPSKNTIGDYLDREWQKVSDGEGKLLGEEGRDRPRLTPGEEAILINSMGQLTEEESAYLNDKETIRISKRERIKSIKYSHNIRNTMLQQRLYLSALLREGHLTPMLKEEIWKKVAEFLPSRIAAFFPDETREIMKYEHVLTTEERQSKKEEEDKLTEREKAGKKEEEDKKWEALSDKLFMAEMDRVREQAEKVKNNDFAEVKLSEFYDRNGITTRGEIAYIEEIIKLGQNKSKILSIMIFPQSAFLDDAPEPEWMNLGKETVGRLLVNDYEGYNTANNERNAVIGNPSMRLAESAEHLVKAKDGYASPIGTQDAQDRLEADVLTRYELYGMDTSSKWGFYSINRALKRPTSPIEKSNVDANISMDELAISQDVDFLSQHSVVNNDKARLDFLGHTQSERIKKKAKARLMDLWIRNLRLFLMLFPLAFSTEFIKMIAPDFAKEK